MQLSFKTAIVSAEEIENFCALTGRSLSTESHKMRTKEDLKEVL